MNENEKKKNIKKTLTLTALIGLSCTTNAQVTIGSINPPRSGVLLDLNEYKASTQGGATATRGLLLPRVELGDLNKLIIGNTEILDTDDGGDQYIKHDGLTVYNMSEALPFCKGVYVWGEFEWQRLGTPCTYLKIAPNDPLYFLSGLNGSTITSRNITVDWFPGTINANYINTAQAPFGMVNFGTNGISPDAPWTGGSTTVSLTPMAMTASETSDPGGNPFLSKESEIQFSITNGGKEFTESVIVNQTNKAITIDGKMSSVTILDPLNNTTFTHSIESNAIWNLSNINPDNTGTTALSGITLNGNAATLGVPFGKELINSTADTPVQLKYTVTNTAGKARYNQLVFSDNQNPKRFTDISISVFYCNNNLTGVNPTMSEWASAAGFIGVPTVKISEADDISKGRDVPNSTTGIAWHRDQDGNIFLSSNFDKDSPVGNGERWMITNLAAKKYDTNANPLVPMNPVGRFNSEDDPGAVQWAYIRPNGSTDGYNSALYDSNPRIGLYYTWAAATGSKASHEQNPEDPSNPHIGIAVINDGGTDHAKVQGICPNGWHLPSDYEWTVLENKIINNTATFSSTPDISSSPNVLSQSVNATGYRGTEHGNAMKEMCERPFTTGSNSVYYSTSNPISTTLRSGMNLLLTGSAQGNLALGMPSASNLNGGGNYWTSSAYTNYLAGGANIWQYGGWSRGFTAINAGGTTNYSKVYRTGVYQREWMMPVRCKKD